MGISLFFIVISTATLVLNTLFHPGMFKSEEIQENFNESLRNETNNSLLISEQRITNPFKDEDELEIFTYTEAVCVGIYKLLV